MHSLGAQMSTKLILKTDATPPFLLSMFLPHSRGFYVFLGLELWAPALPFMPRVNLLTLAFQVPGTTDKVMVSGLRYSQPSVGEWPGV